MSQPNRKYKRLEALLSGSSPVHPEPESAPANQEVAELKEHIAELETQLAGQKHPENLASMGPPADPGSPSAPLQSIHRPAANPTADPRTGAGARATNASWLLPTLLIVYLASSVVYAIALTQTGAWQMQIALASSLLLALIAGIALRLNRIGRGAQGTILDIYAMVLFFPIISTLYVGGIGLTLGFITPIATMLLAGALLTRKQAIWAVPAGILSGLASILFDLYWPYSRIDVPLLHAFVSGAILLSVVVFILVVVRQFPNYTIRTKLIISFVLMGVTAVLSVVFFVDRSSRTSLTDTIGNNLAGLAVGEADQVAQVLESEMQRLNTLAISKAVQDRAEAAAAADPLSPAEIQALDQQWRAADAADNNSDPLVARVLNDSLSAELRKYGTRFPKNVEVFLTDPSGLNIAAIGRSSDYLQADEKWWQVASIDGEYIGQPEFDASSKTLVINMAVVVRSSSSNKVVGILRTSVNISSLATVLRGGEFGETGRTDIYLPDGRVIKLIPSGVGKSELTIENTDLDVKTLSQSTKSYLNTTLDNRPSLLSLADVSVSDNVAEAGPINRLGWFIVTHQDQSEALLPVTTQTQGNILLTVIVAFLAALAALGLAQVLASPIIRLNAAAERVAAGDLSVQARVETHDEIGTLASTFNNMTLQLGALFGSMEQHVLERTHDLELASEVGRTITERVSSIYDMLSEATEMIRSRFGLYYTQVYLLDPSGNTLSLRAGTGEVGQQLLRHGHHLLVNSGSLNGRAASEKTSIIVSDTSKNTGFLPNSLLPDTRSEMVVPLIVSGRVLGVLDMQSEVPGALNASNLPAFETLAGQLSIAIQNAALFAQSEEARRQVEANVRGATETGWQDFLNAIERGEKIGYTFNQTDVIPMESMDGMNSTNALNVPITVTGANVGTIRLVEESRNWTTQEIEIVQAAAEQLAQHIDNLRLLAQAVSYRAEAEQATRRLTREGWETFRQTRSDLIGFTYDLNNVNTLENDNNGQFETAITKQFAVRNETLGELAVNIGDKTPEEINELISAVAEQLGSHIENLRLSEQNEKRAFELATVATVSTTASTVLDPDKLLQSVVDLTKERFNVYHTHIYLADKSWETLLLAAGAGEVGKQMVEKGHAIQIDAVRSLVARASRERRSIIVNDVRAEAGFLPNPLLPETRAEMAVPMIVGDKVVGVFDVQANAVNHFTDEDASIYTTLASQVAVALQNARLYVEQAATVTQLRELDRLKSAFLANMSHELRTPLNSILGFADVMLEELDGPLTENMNNDLGLIQKNGQHLLHLINDVLDMAKIESGKMNLNPENFKIHEILADVTSITSTMASEKNLVLFIEKGSDQKLEIYGDRTRLRQVMINLVNNAIKFTEKGKISIHAKQEDERVLICIKDTGIGIPPDKLEAVFQEFTQMDVSSTRQSGGTGLGLPISRRLIELHGGRIWAESTGVSGEGCSFYVELPIQAMIVEPIEKQEK